MGEFRFRRGESYFMPAHFGPRTEDWDGRYDRATATMVLYATDPGAASALLPPGFEVADPPLVSVIHAENRGVHVLEGGGYNLVGVNLAASYRGERDQRTGSYSLVMWEDTFLPVMLGREFLGVPKLMAEIPDVRIGEGRRAFTVSEQGTKLLDAEVHGLKELDEAGVRQVQDRLAASAWMAWRCFATLDARDIELSYPTVIGIERDLRRAWMGQGSVRFFDVEQREAPLSYHIARALRQLPVVREMMAVVTEGSIVQGLATRLR